MTDTPDVDGSPSPEAPMPQFPLGTVLVPQQPLPLNIFEPRYREMLTDILAGDRRFGVVLIERGQEVGGGDARCGVGTVARLERHEIFADGSAAVLAVGEARMRVIEWADDDPYPRARIRVWPDEVEVVDPAIRARVEALARDTLELAAKLARRQLELPERLVFDHDDVAASYQLTGIAPVSPFDKQRLLEASGPGARFDLLNEILDEARDLLRFRLE